MLPALLLLAYSSAADAPPAPTSTPPSAPASTPAPAAPVLPPTLLAPATPAYPPEALPERLAGEVWLTVQIAEDGSVTQATPDASALPVFVPAAVTAAQQLRFSPATQGGVPVAVSMRVVFRFSPPEEAPEEAPDDDVQGIEVDIHGARHTEPARGASDFRIETETMRPVPRKNATELLTLAPGVFLTQSGGSGDAEQIFLRGFDAREGQDIGFSLEGMPLNDVGNPHGHGLTDLHFLVPEAVSQVRVVEGPFSPTQGDFAVAGSADYRLGLPSPGWTLKGEAGSFSTRRWMLGWRPEDDAHTFVTGEVAQTQGYGENRAASHASVLARAHGEGEDAHWSLLGGLYSATYDSAGLVRQDDVDAGRIDLYGTYDTRQGGSGTRAFVSGVLESGEDEEVAWRLQGWAQARTMDIRSNYTGFLLDDRRPGESPHDQRGDLLEQVFTGHSAGVRGQAGQPWSLTEAVNGRFTAGVDGRADLADGTSQRLRDADGAPYRVELAYTVQQVDVAPWADIEAHLGDRVRLQAGARAESLTYRVLDGCAQKDYWFPGSVQDDVNCPSIDRYGTRLPSARRTASGRVVVPRGVADVSLNDAWTLSAAYGQGVRSMEAVSLSDDESAPFARIDAGELGATWVYSGESAATMQRLVGFVTRVDKDLIFDEAEGRNVVAGETIRTGAMWASEAQVFGVHHQGSVTWTYGVFGDDIPPSYAYYHSDRQAGMLIPYVPPWVVREDLSTDWEPVEGVTLTHGVGVSWIAPRPLPQSEQSDAVLTVDVGSAAKYGPVELGVSVTNALNRSYALAEYNFSSSFPDSSPEDADFPTRVPTRQVSPGAPRAISLSLTVTPNDKATP